MTEEIPFAHITDEGVLRPEPFTRMPLRWERSAGGPLTSNPAGVWDSAGHQAGEEREDPTCAAPSAILSFQRDETARLFLVTVDLAKKQSPADWGGPMRSAPGGRRCRETCMVPLEADIALESRRWSED